MIKFFRHIRKSLLMENKTGKYFKYAIGEILLVVIGILIALWINNLNTENQQQKEKNTLLFSLEQELNENLDEFNNRIKRLNKANKNLINVLNLSANKSTTISIDSLKQYLKETLLFAAINLNNSRLNSAKTSGKFNLIPQHLISSFTEYETSINNYLEFISETTQVFNDDWSDLIIRLNTLNSIHNNYYPNTNIKTHPGLDLNDEQLIEYLSRPKTYKIMHRYYVKFMTETAWLEISIASIVDSLTKIKKELND